MKSKNEQVATKIAQCVTEVTKQSQSHVQGKKWVQKLDEYEMPIPFNEKEKAARKKERIMISAKNSSIDKNNDKVVKRICGEYNLPEAHIRMIMKSDECEDEEI